MCIAKKAQRDFSSLFLCLVGIAIITIGCPGSTPAKTPHVTISTTASDPTNVSPIPVMVVFSQSVTGFDLSDLVVTNGTINAITGSGTTYSFEIVPSAEGTVTVKVNAEAVSNSSGDSNPTGAQFSIVYDPFPTSDTLLVTMSTTASDPTDVSPIPVTVTFSEPVTGFDLSDLVVFNGAINAFTGSGTDYSFEIVPSVEDRVTVIINAGAASNSSGDFNAAGAQLSRMYDVSRPTVVLTSSHTSPTQEAPIAVSASFSENVSDFEAVDVTVSNATVQNFVGENGEYTFNLVPLNDGEVTVSIAENVAQDLGGRLNEASNELTWSFSWAEAITIYVSSSEGDDTNDGLSESTPKATIEAGRAMLRDLNPDSLLLKRGDTWNESLAWLWDGKSGRSATEHMVLGAYGLGARPIIEELVQARGFRAGHGEPPLSHLTIENIHFKNCSVISMGAVSDFVIQDCFVEKGRIGIKDSEEKWVRDIVIRRCIVYRNSTTGSGHAQGIFINGVDGITIEYCLLDHNGWDENIPGAEATIFNHNVYIQNGTKGLVFRNNVVARASSHGIQARTGGIIEDNFFVRNPLPILVGGGDHPEPEGVTGSVRGNVLIEGGDITESIRRAHGITITNVGFEGVTVADNLVMHDVSASPYGHGIMVKGEGAVGANNVLVENNIVYDWRNSLIVEGEVALVKDVIIRNNTLQLYHHIDMPSAINDQRTLVSLDHDYGDAVDFSGNTYFSNADPERWFIYGTTYLTTFSEWSTQFADDGATSQSVLFDHPTADAEIEHSVEVYNSQILGGEASLDAFLQAARENWGDQEYSAAALIDYFRAGFGLD